MASKSAKVIKIPGAKMPTMKANLPSVPKAPKLNGGLRGYATASKMILPG